MRIVFQVVNSFSDNTYPYRHISKYSTADYACWYPQCTQDIAKLKDFQAAGLSKWTSLAETLRGDAEVVRQFDRLETMFLLTDHFNLTQCDQDFPTVLTVQKAVYDKVFNICLIEAIKQNALDYTSNMTALEDIIMYLDADTHQQVYVCGADADCKNSVESSAQSQLTYEENRALVLVDWYEKRMLFDNVNSVRECVQFKTFEQVGDLKKIINTVEDCLSYVMTIR